MTRQVLKRVYRQLRKLDSWFNPQARVAVEKYEQGREITLEQTNIALFSTNVIKEPTTFDEAWNCNDKSDQIKWREANNKELNEMKNKGIWEVIDFSEVPNNRSVNGSLRFVECSHHK